MSVVLRAGGQALGGVVQGFVELARGEVASREVVVAAFDFEPGAGLRPMLLAARGTLEHGGGFFGAARVAAVVQDPGHVVAGNAQGAMQGGGGIGHCGHALARRSKQRQRTLGVVPADADRGCGGLGTNLLFETEAAAISNAGFCQRQARQADAQRRLRHVVGDRMAGQRGQSPAAVVEGAEVFAAQMNDEAGQRGELLGGLRRRGVGAQSRGHGVGPVGMVGPGLLQELVEARSHAHLTRSRSCAGAPRCRPSRSAP